MMNHWIPFCDAQVKIIQAFVVTTRPLLLLVMFS